jgi:hypothetical protein
MESTAQYWRPVWQQLEGLCHLHLAQAHSNRAPKGRKRDFEDAQRLVRRFVAGELILSYVPDATQRLWRTMTRTKQQLTCDRVRLRNQMEAFLEESHIKLSGQVSDLFGMSGLRILRGVAHGGSDPCELAALAVPALRASREQLADALQAVVTLSPLRRQILRLFLERLELIDQQREVLAQSLAECLREHQQALTRLAKTGPGSGFGTADYCRDWAARCQFRFCRPTGLLGRVLPGSGRKRGGLPQRPLAQGQPCHAPHSLPSGPRRHQSQGQHFSGSVSSAGAPSRVPEGYLGGGPQALSRGVEDTA